MFGLQGKIYAGIFAVVGLMVAGSMADRGLNYVETTARVTSISVDCYVKSGKKKVVEKGTSNLAYMNCNLAPMIAKRFGHSQSAVRKRAKIEYDYQSPVDGNYYTGNFTDGYYKDNRSQGTEFTIYAHTEEPESSRIR